VAKVKDDIEYSNHLIKVHNVMNVLDLPNNQEEAFRESLTKQDNKTLEELSKKSKKEILLFLTQQNQENNKSKTERIEQKLSQIDSKANEKDTQNHQENQKQNQDIQKIKSVFTPQILEQNSTLSDEFKKLDNEKERQGALNKILDLLKSDNGKILKSITEQL
jgi:actin-related protein